MATMVIKTVKPSGGDYTSLSAWEAGEQRDLVTLNEIAVVECYSMSDTTAVVVLGWVTGVSNYIRIYTPTTERHDGKWNAGKYRLEPIAQYASALDVREPYTEIEGLQVRRAHTGTGDTKMALILSGASNSTVSHSIFTSGGVASYGIYTTSSTGSKIFNNLIYDVGGYGINGYGSLFVYNNTVINSTVGIGHNSGDSSKTWVLKNNLVTGSTTLDYENLSGTYTLTYCASSDATADDWGGTGNRINQTFTFVDTVNKDFHLTSGDAGAKNFGTDLSADSNIAFTTDIDGETRSGTWDIGADEYIAAGGGIIPVSGNTIGGSAYSGVLISDLVVGGAAVSFSSATGLAGLALSLAASTIGLAVLSASAGVKRSATGAVYGVSVMSGAVTTAALSTLSGSVNSITVLNGGVSMGYGFGGLSLSALTMTGHINEILSSLGVVSAASSMTGFPTLIGTLSPATLAGSPKFDVTRYGGGAPPMVHVDSAAATVTQDNNNPKVTR